MITSRSALVNALQTYRTSFAEEAAFVQQFLGLLKNERCYHRDFLPGHITGSAWIIDASKQSVLLTHHAKLNKWLQPGGHADGDENIRAVALREAEEETGLTQLTDLSSGIFDIDVHTIPARKEFPEHLHFDVRFAFQAIGNQALVITEESNDLKWVPLHALGDYSDNGSILRMKQKLQ